MRYKLIASSVGLVGFGAMWGWALTGDYWERKAKSNQQLLGDILVRKTQEAEAAKELLINRPVISRPESSSEKIARMAAEHAVPDEEPGEQDIQAAYEEDRLLDEQLKGETPEETRSNLQKIIDRYVPADSDDLEAFSEMASRVVEEPAMNTPHVISQQNFAWDEEGGDYEKGTLTWYPRHRLLLDEEEEPIDNKDIDSVVGWSNLNRFGDESGQPDVVFIRNRRLGKDFEVVREEDDEPPVHIRHNMGREEYRANEHAGTLVRFRRDDI